MRLWFACINGSFGEGIARAVAGEPGTPQDESKASYAAAFTEAEHWLDWAEPGHILHRKAAALNLFHPAAKGQIAGRDYVIAGLTRVPDAPTSAPPGTVLDRDDEGLTIAVGDGVVRVVARPSTVPGNT